MDKGDLGGFLSWLSGGYDVYAPVRRGDVVTFDVWAEGDDVVLDHETTNTPVKKAFFPPRETLLEFKGGEVNAPIHNRKVLVFGIHPYDVAALKVLDEAFMNKTDDTYYARRRKDSVLIAVEHGEIPNAFYGELGVDLDGGYDVMLLDEGDHYIFDAKTKRGHEIVKNGHVKTRNAKAREPRIPKAGERIIDLEKTSRFLDRGPEHEIWRKLAEECFACGVCSYVCPICHCFDVEDRLDIAGSTGERARTWDSCMLADFAAVAGGLNFRGKRHERIHNWYHHKFSRAVKERKKPDCVGCGRCITYCPAKIRIHDVIMECEGLG